MHCQADHLILFSLCVNAGKQVMQEAHNYIRIWSNYVIKLPTDKD